MRNLISLFILLPVSLLMAAPETAAFRDWAETAFLHKDKAGVVEPGIVVRRQDYATLRLKKSVMDTPLKIGDQQFERGLGAHSFSEIAVQLPAQAKKFSAQVGVDNNHDTQGKRGSVVFAVEAKGKELFRSGLCKGGDAPVPVSVDVAGAEAVVLRVLDGGDGCLYDQSDWADAKVEVDGGKEVYLDDFPLGPQAQGLSKQAPFSFVFGGKSSLEFLTTWKETVTSEAPANGKERHLITCMDPVSGMEVRCELTCFTDYPAVEWVLLFKNAGTADSPIIEQIKPLDLSVGIPDADVVLHRMNGSTCSATDFMPIDQVVGRPKAQIDIAPNGGRSSDGALPFFNLEWEKGGLVGAIGWSGQWALQVRRDNERSVRLLAGQQTSRLVLHPGEEIRSPRILLVSWKGSDYLRGNNLLRRLILAHYSPRCDGKLVLPPASANTWFAFNEGNSTTEENQKAVMPVMAQIGLEAYWMDAGWFEGGWPAGAGSWVPKKEAFPNGLKPIGDAAHKLGLKYVLWFEPERVTSISRVTKEHPEWVMHHPDEGTWGSLFNMGNPDACKWMTEYLSKCISDWGIDVLRIDFNVPPLPFWQAADTPDRQGMSEIRYVENVYAMWDALLKKHPGLAIDNCASGGRRIDLETISRSYPLWQSDTQCGGRAMPVQDQTQNLGLSMYVPLHSAGVWAFDPYSFRSVATTGASICPNIPKDEKMLATMRKRIEEMKALRPFCLGDYYPLMEVSLSEAVWCGWQYDCPEAGGGFVTLFRRSQSPYHTAGISLRGLDAEAAYTVTDIDTGNVINKSGKELIAGLDVKIEAKPRCVLLQYQRDTKKP